MAGCTPPPQRWVPSSHHAGCSSSPNLQDVPLTLSQSLPLPWIQPAGRSHGALPHDGSSASLGPGGGGCDDGGGPSTPLAGLDRTDIALPPAAAAAAGASGGQQPVQLAEGDSNGGVAAALLWQLPLGSPLPDHGCMAGRVMATVGVPEVRGVQFPHPPPALEPCDGLA